ncbi:Virulence factors putative positive transcription regulator BvgA [compost metagenome]
MISAVLNMEVAWNMAKVVIIDSHPLSARGMESTLNNAGHQVLGVASNGVAGLALARTLAPDLIVLELEVPKLGGLDLIKRLAARKTSTPMLVCTALPADVYEPLCLNAGASGFVAKTDSPASFSDAVTKVLRGNTYSAAVENRIPYMMVVVVSLRGERRVIKHGGCPVPVSAVVDVRLQMCLQRSRLWR